jgi:hypothetical protein
LGCCNIRDIYPITALVLLSVNCSCIPLFYEECKTYSDETVVSLSLRSGDDLVIQSPSHEIESIETHAAPLVGGVRDQAALDQATLSDAATDHSLPADTQDPLERCVQ